MVEVLSDGPLARPLYRFGLFTLDPAARLMTRNGVRVRLQDQPFQLVLLLLENSGNIVSKEEIRQRLWPENTFVDFDKSLGVAVLKAREALGDTADNPRFIETVPRRGYRFVAPVHTDLPTIPDNGKVTAAQHNLVKKPFFKMLWTVASIGFVVLACVTGILLLRSRARVPEHASIVIGEFSNRTGDPVFNESLRRAVVIQLAQSPYLLVLSDQRLGEILQGIGRSPDDALTSGLALQVCQHGQAAALVTGSIQKTGGSFVLSMDAERCSDQISLAHETVTVGNKQQVLARLGDLTFAFRRKLGESRETLQKYAVPLEEATTSSLDALKAYQLGLDLRAHSKTLESRPVFKTAIALDPNFAIAYAQLGSAFSNLGDTKIAKLYFQKAFDLRVRATEPERLYITGRYFDIVTGELEKGSETYKLWTELYPNEWKAYNAVANDANLMGRYETVVNFSRKTVQLAPKHDFGYINLISGLIALNQLDEARKLCDQLLAEGRDHPFVHLDLYAISYLEHDSQTLQLQREWAARHPGDVNMVYAQAQAAAREGKIKASTNLFEQAAKMNIAEGDTESAANALATAAEANSELGRPSVAKGLSERALKLGENEIVLGLSAVVAVRARDLSRAQALMEKTDHDYPIATFSLGVYSPMVRAGIAVLHRVTANQVTEIMEPALPYEYGSVADMLPIYIRGVSYQALHAPDEAAAEFQKIITHPSVDAVTNLYPLAWLGMARCYAAQGNAIESRNAYRQLFEMWKSADEDLPPLKEARQEFRRLGK